MLAFQRPLRCWPAPYNYARQVGLECVGFDYSLGGIGEFLKWDVSFFRAIAADVSIVDGAFVAIR